MREGMVLYDARGTELWACPNIDGRAGAEAAQLVESGLAQEIYERSGDWVSITAPPRFLWLARHEPGCSPRSPMWACWATGSSASCPENSSATLHWARVPGCSSLPSRDWSERILEIVGLEPSVFPPVVDPGMVVGGLTADAAAQTGLLEGIPVVAGGADTQLALLGLGITDPGRFTIVGGTFWQHTVVLDEPLVDPGGRLRTLCHTVPGRWMIEGIGFYCGMVMRWFRDAFCEFEQIEAEREGVDVYELLERKAASCPPGSNGVFGIFSNVMQANHWVHASPGFVGFDVDQPARAGRIECFRAIEESAAYVSRGHLRIVEEIADAPVDGAILTGGAAKGRLWAQIIADTLGLPVRIPVVKESTALGAALYAGVGAGLFADAAQMAREITRVERTVEPQADARAAYDGLYEQWSELYRRSLEISEAGLARPLWRAAGT